MAYLRLPLLFLISLSVSAHSKNLSREEIIERVIKPVIRGREQYFELKPQQSPTQISFLAVTQSQMGERQIVGNYQIDLAQADHLDLKVEDVQTSEGNQKRIIGRASLEPIADQADSIASAQGWVRNLLQGNPYLHPQLRPNEATPFVTSEPQAQVLKEMGEINENSRTGFRVLLHMPTGNGKTYVVSEWLRRQIRSGVKAPRIVFIIQNRQVLEEAAKTLAAVPELGLDRATNTFVSGNLDDRMRFEESWKRPESRAWFLSRSAAYNNREHLYSLLSQDEPVVFVFDEAHHLGRSGIQLGDEETETREIGEFKELIDHLGPKLRAQDQMIGMTATSWHQESDLVRRIFKGNLVAAYLSQSEKKEFLKTKDYVKMSQLTTFRAMAAGFISPLYSYRQILYLGDQTRALDFLRGARMRAILELDPDQQTVALRRQTTIHIPLLKTMLEDLQSKAKELNRETASAARGMIFVSSRAMADFYADEISRLAQADANGPQIEFKSYHSGKSREDNKAMMSWFKEETAKTQHRYLFVVKSLSEGFDFPQVNHIVLAKGYSVSEMISMRELLQNIGRGARVAPYKVRVYITDFSGKLYDLIFKTMDSLSFRRALLSPYKPPQQLSPASVVVEPSTPDQSRFAAETVPVLSPAGVTEAVQQSSAQPESASALFRRRFWFANEQDRGKLGILDLVAQSSESSHWQNPQATEFSFKAFLATKAQRIQEEAKSLKNTDSETLRSALAEFEKQASSGKSSVTVLAIRNAIKTLVTAKGEAKRATDLLALPLRSWPEVLGGDSADAGRNRDQLVEDVYAHLAKVWKVKTLADFYYQIDHQIVFEKLSHLERSPNPRDQALVAAFIKTPTLVRALSVCVLAELPLKKTLTPQQVKARAQTVTEIVEKLVTRLAILQLPLAGAFRRSDLVVIKEDGSVAAAGAVARGNRQLPADLKDLLLGVSSRQVQFSALTANEARERGLTELEPYFMTVVNSPTAFGEDLKIEDGAVMVGSRTATSLNWEASYQKRIYDLAARKISGLTSIADLLKLPLRSWPMELVIAKPEDEVGYRNLKEVLGIETLNDLVLYLGGPQFLADVDEVINSSNPEIPKLIDELLLKNGSSSMNRLDRLSRTLTLILLLRGQSTSKVSIINDFEFNFRQPVFYRILARTVLVRHRLLVAGDFVPPKRLRVESAPVVKQEVPQSETIGPKLIGEKLNIDAGAFRKNESLGYEIYDTNLAFQYLFAGRRKIYRNRNLVYDPSFFIMGPRSRAMNSLSELGLRFGYKNTIIIGYWLDDHNFSKKAFLNEHPFEDKSYSGRTLATLQAMGIYTPADLWILLNEADLNQILVDLNYGKGKFAELAVRYIKEVGRTPRLSDFLAIKFATNVKTEDGVWLNTELSDLSDAIQTLIDWLVLSEAKGMIRAFGPLEFGYVNLATKIRWQDTRRVRQKVVADIKSDGIMRLEFPRPDGTFMCELVFWNK